MTWLMEWNEDATIRALSDDGTKKEGDCQRTTVRFLAGAGRTDASGNWVLKVADVVCEQIGAVRGVSFVATTTFNPLVDAAGAPTDSIPIPSYPQTAHTASGGYVTLYVRTWNCRCEPAPNTPFDYHVAISYDFVDEAGTNA
ncbi:MAG TPA: hypothetical protein VFJ16_05795 [Longimicrobium sp.]|nr:hypothetical protein [Longimicrobium sp.]